MSRLFDGSDVWINLAEKSLLRYEMIEYESGIKFYNECGFLSLIDEKVSIYRLVNRISFFYQNHLQYEDEDSLDRAKDILLDSGYKCLKTEAGQLRYKENSLIYLTFVSFRSMFPFLKIAENIKGYFQPDFSGYINPRKLIEAQLKIAQKFGCQVIRCSGA